MDDAPPGERGARRSVSEQEWQTLTTAVRDGGALSLRFFKTEINSWKKTDKTPVSDADLAVDTLLKDRLLNAFPDYGWLSEETDDDPRRLEVDRVWVVDPIDGTRAFLKGKPHFCISVALVTDGRPIAAVIFNPATDEFFEARVGGGAFLNGDPVTAGSRSVLEHCRMLGDPQMFRHPAWPEPWPDMEFEFPNSIAYRFALVASGQWDAAISLNWKSDWDLAAADLIVTEAGGRMTRHDGQPFVYNQADTNHRSVICAGPNLYPEIFRRVGHIQLP